MCTLESDSDSEGGIEARSESERPDSELEAWLTEDHDLEPGVGTDVEREWDFSEEDTDTEQH
jgi:hypothetical protein